MKLLSAITSLVICFGLFAFYAMKPVTLAQSAEPIAVIELFSSQGCSSCPPADELLSKTIYDAGKTKKNLFALSFHVDYWDRLGWKDPFSNKKFTERQNAYANKLNLNSCYTPQMIVNGTREFVGSDAKALDKALEQAWSTKPEAFFKSLSLSFDEKNAPVAQYELQGDYSHCQVNLALLSLTEKTNIKRGENSGLILVNDHVVNQFISKDATEKGSADFLVSPLPAKDNLLLIAYVQNTITLKITGAAQFK